MRRPFAQHWTNLLKDKQLEIVLKDKEIEIVSMNRSGFNMS